MKKLLTIAVCLATNAVAEPTGLIPNWSASGSGLGVASSIYTFPQHLIIGKISINLQTSEIEFKDGYIPDEAAQEFWSAVRRYAPNCEARPK